MGSYLIPATVDVPLDLAVNPWGVEERGRKFVWNDGDNRRKLITLANKADRQKRGRLTPGGGIHVGATSGAPFYILQLSSKCILNLCVYAMQ